MPPKAAATKSSAQPSRVSSRVKAAPKPATATSTTVAKAPATKRKADDTSDTPPSKKRTTAASSKSTASKVSKPPQKAAVKQAGGAPKAAKGGRVSKAAKQATKPAPIKKTAPASSSKTSQKASTKRKSGDASDAPSKRARLSPQRKQALAPRPLPEINPVPTEKLDVFVMGEGESGELGLGTTKKAIGVKRPRLHPALSTVDNVVQVALGGMHAAALTQKNEILTWGVNDNGACGRDTAWEGRLKDADASSDSDSDSDEDDDTGLNPLEAVPIAISSRHFPKGTKFVQLAAGDSCTFVLTAEGLVYGCGTFRDNNGILGFRPELEHARTPVLIPELKNIKHIACGNNHALALDASGNVFVWGAGEQNQLGRRIVERTRMTCLTPRLLGLPKKQTKYISSGGEHSFAITKNNKVYAWGLNNFGQTGIPDNAGEDEAIIPAPTIVKQLSDYKLDVIKGGSHHSVAVTNSGTCLTWGRADGGQVGIATETLPEEDVIKNHGRVGILKKPTAIPGLQCKYATTASDHSIALTTSGQAYSWGFSGLYQTGLGTDEDVKTATLIDNTAVRGRDLNWAGTGGQYSALTSISGTPNHVSVNGPSAAASAAAPIAQTSASLTVAAAPAAIKAQSPTIGAAVVNGTANGDVNRDVKEKAERDAAKPVLANGIVHEKKSDGDTAAPLLSASPFLTNGI